MSKDFLEGASDEYDVVVIGSGLAGLTAANTLARAGHRVLLLEHHYKLGGLATWFRRPGGHIFDVSLHGFPVGMIKSCRRYWNQQIADSIVQLKHIRFDNPMFSLSTTFDRKDFTRQLVNDFGIEPSAVENFFDTARSMSHLDDTTMTAGELFEKFLSRTRRRDPFAHGADHLCKRFYAGGSGSHLWDRFFKLHVEGRVYL